MSYSYSRRDFLAGVLATGTASSALTYFTPGGRTIPSVTLKLITGFDPTGARDLLISMWNQANPRTNVESVAVRGTTLNQKSEMETHAANGDADILNLDIIDIPYFQSMNYITTIEIDDSAGFLPKTLMTSRVGNLDAGPYWAVPFNTDVGLLFERIGDQLPRDDQPLSLATVIDELVPDESHQFAGQLQATSSSTAEAFTINVLEHALSRNDSILTSDDGRPSRKLVEWQSALEPLHAAICKGRVEVCDGEDDTRDKFRNRELRYMRNWPVKYRELQISGGPSLDISRIQVHPITSGVLGGQSLALVRKSPKIDRAREFIRFLTSEQSQKILAAYGLAATKLQAYADPSLGAFIPHLKQIQGAVERARLRPSSKNYSAFSKAFFNHVLKPLRQREGFALTTQFIDDITAALN